MTFDEMLAECEARRAERRHEPVNFIPRYIPRRVRLSPVCTCWMCTNVYARALEMPNVSRETVEAADG
jgi:hypothetical protein